MPLSTGNEFPANVTEDQVPGVLCLAGDADHRAGEEARVSIMALQLPVAPAPITGTDHNTAPWLAKPQLKPADCVPEESVGGVPIAAPLRRGRAPAGADSPRVLQDAETERQPDAQSPAGGVGSTERDLSRWMRPQLGDGTFEGE